MWLAVESYKTKDSQGGSGVFLLHDSKKFLQVELFDPTQPLEKRKTVRIKSRFMF
tara:strand:+ start:900 stop:1064 length:165 start_codon:yes stop_codon:yes gene_type:complete